MSKEKIAARYRLAVASRAIAAIGGGYALSALAAMAMALYLPLHRAEAVITGTLASFVFYTGAVMWAFAARTAWSAWGGLALPSLLLAAGLWWLQRAGAAA
ncbi:MAG TPA: DUF3649 domain-containing protein [Pseudorhodoferax sp.]|jgi:hypothetical protein|nr:DUF3649 domain-containing protein [Pseudorhodoferax sp.]